ncbi:MAG: hypothetical protein R8K53_06495, partial [Mariprofundaceae bacterium]
MRDLVETVISQVMRQEPSYASPASIPTTRHAEQNTHRTHELTPPGTGGGQTHHANERLWQVSRQFETIFVEQMLTSMRKTVPDS